MESSLPSSIETNRLLLRHLSLDDANEIFLLRSDEKHNEFVDRPRATSIEDAKAFIIMIQNFTSKQQSFFWAIQVKGEETLAGTVTLWNLNREKNKAEMGYELLSIYQGRGIMSEAATAVLNFGFKDLRLSRIEACPHPKNDKSIALLRKLSFKRDLDAESKKPADLNEIIYSLTAEDYLYK